MVIGKSLIKDRYLENSFWDLKHTIVELYRHTCISIHKHIIPTSVDGDAFQQYFFKPGIYKKSPRGLFQTQMLRSHYPNDLIQ